MLKSAMKLNLSPKKSAAREERSASVTSPPPDMKGTSDDEVSPELVPIVTLLSAQSHRRYHEGILMLYYDLNSDGKAGDREWKEVYGILTGTQLAYWDAASLARFKDSPEKLFEHSSKPKYLNFTDAIFNAMRVLPAAKQQLENVIIVSTTLKNRYILQFRSYETLTEWYMALRLATYEYNSLQEAYTGALLSARGSRLSDIRTILAEKRYNHSDWVKVRYGSGMAWKQCYAVIEPSTYKKKQFTPGRVLLYDNEKMKKSSLLGTITSASSVTAVYPQSPFFIDKSTIMKLEGAINFSSPSVKKSKKNAAASEETSLFLMPEQHSAVAGYDTLIRFLIPLLDSFGLYGRPKRLKADRVDPDSLLFGLPTLPRVHYLMVGDLHPLAGTDAFLSWDQSKWTENIKRILKSKLNQGYNGCGSSRGFAGALNSISPRNSPTTSRMPSNALSDSPNPQKVEQTRNASGPIPALSQPLLQPKEQNRAASLGNPSSAQEQPTSQQLPKQNAQRHRPPPVEDASYNQPGYASSKNAPNLSLNATPRMGQSNLAPSSIQGGVVAASGAAATKLDDPHKSVHLLDIYQKYSTIESPSDRFHDRNQILKGGAEEIEEDRLPTLMRKKSLMRGIYPTNDDKLLGSESESEEEEEEDEDEDDDDEGFVRQVGASSLQVPNYDKRNSSMSSVQSPTTQYNEFNRQFSKAVDTQGPLRNQRYESSSEEEGSTEEETDDEDDDEEEERRFPQQSARGQPHGSIPRADQVPQLQHLNLNDARDRSQQSYAQPQSQHAYGQSAPGQQAYGQSAPPRQQSPTSLTLQKSRPSKNLTSELQTEQNRPRFIQSPNSSQNHLPHAKSPAPAEQNPPVRIVEPKAERTEESSPTVAPTAAFRVQPQQPVQYMPHGQSQHPYQQQHHHYQQQQYQQQQYQQRPPQAYANSGIPPSVTQPNLSRGAQPTQQPAPHQYQHRPVAQQPQQGHPHQYHQAQQSQQPKQRSAHPYQQRAQQQYQAQPPQQGQAYQKSSGVSQQPMHPNASSPSVRSYGDGQQVYQYQPQPQQRHLQQPPNGQSGDPRYRPNGQPSAYQRY